jgi:integral membrane sensor domain MASE1
MEKLFKGKLSTTLLAWLLNVFFTIVIFYTSELGKFLALHGAPIAISIMWLPSGFSVAGFLLFGKQIWPGIFLGNFLYSFIHLYLDSGSTVAPFFTSLFIGAITASQALFIAYIMKRFSSRSLFTTAKDILIFLVSTLLTCMLANALTTIPLYFYDKSFFTPSTLLTVWNYFWIEDTLGVYVITPLLVVWSSQRQQNHFLSHFPELIALVVSSSIVSILTFIWGDPFAHLFVPISLWAAYVFKMHGATMATFLISLIIVIPTGLNYGAFATHTAYPYLTLTTFIMVCVVSSLMLAALINEREAAWRIIKSKNIDLTDAFQTHMEGFKEIHTESLEKEKISSSLGMLIFGLAKQLQTPLKRLNNLTKASIVSLNRVQEAMRSSQEKMSHEVFHFISGQIKILDGYLHDILKCEKQADKMGHMIQEQASLSSKEKVKIKEVNINKLLTLCLNQSAKQFISKHPHFSFIGKTQFDQEAEMAIVFPQELAHALIFFIKHSFELMFNKKTKLKEIYDPELLIKTINHDNKIEVIIQDNGVGASEEEVRNYFHSFVKDKSIDTKTYDLSLAHDIIVYVQKGDIKVYSEQGSFFKVVLTLPKMQMQNKNHTYVSL